MEIHKKFFSKVMSENEEVYFASLIGVIESVDELASLEITKTPTSFLFRLIPSVPRYTNSLVEELIKFHNLLGIRLNMSKSIKTTAVLSFKINTSF